MKTLFRIVLPAIIIFLGAVFAIIVLSIMLPLYDVIGKFG